MALCYNINDLREKIASPEGSCWQKSFAGRQSFPLPLGAVGASASQCHVQHLRGGKEKQSRICSIPKRQLFTSYFARSKGTCSMMATWREGLVMCRMQQQREGKEVPRLQKDCLTSSSQEPFPISPSLHNLGAVSVFLIVCSIFCF